MLPKFSTANFNSKKIKKHLLPKVRNNKEKYLNKLINLVKKNKIRLIIPLADYDLEILAEKKNKFKELNCEVVISSHKLVKNLLIYYVKKIKLVLPIEPS